MAFVHDAPEERFNIFAYRHTITFKPQSTMNLKLKTQEEQGSIELIIRPKMKYGFIMTKVDKDAPYKYLIESTDGAWRQD